MHSGLSILLCVAILLLGCVAQHTDKHGTRESNLALTTSEIRALEQLIRALVGSRSDFLRRVAPSEVQTAQGTVWPDRHRDFEPLIRELRLSGDSAPKMAVFREAERQSGFFVLDHKQEKLTHVADTPSTRIILLRIAPEANSPEEETPTYSIEIGSLYVGLYNFSVSKGGRKIVYEGQTIVN